MRERNKAAQKRWREKYPGRNYESWRRWFLRKQYGISPEQYEQMLADQGGKCATCRREDPKKRLAVDHDHETGEVRGLLCGPCNRFLGWINENPEVLRVMTAYLNKIEKGRNV